MVLARRLARAVLFGPVLFGWMVGGGFWALRNPGLRHALAINRPSVADVESGLLHAFAAAVVFLVVAAIVWRARCRRDPGAQLLDAFACVGRLAVPLLSFPFLAALARPGIEEEQPGLTLFFVALVAGLCARGVYTYELDEPDRPEGLEPIRWQEVAVLAALWAGYALFFSKLAITNHHALNTRTFDLGIYDNVFYQTLHGRPLGCSLLKGNSHSSGHFDPILVLLAPLYWLYPRAELLLVLQSIWLGAGIVPVYLIARRTLEARSAGFVFAAIYVLYPALHGANLYEFHSLTLVAPLLLWMLFLLEIGAHRAYFAVLVAALLCREDVPLLLCFIGLGALLGDRPRNVRAGWITIAASLGYFLIVKAWLLPSGAFFNGGPSSYGYDYIYQGLIPNNRGLGDVLASLVTNPAFVVGAAFTPEKIVFLLLLFLPLGFLPLFAKPGRVMLVYGALFCLLASHFALFSVHFYYAVVIFPIAFALAPLGLRQVATGRLVSAAGLDPRRVERATLTACLVAAALVSWKFGAIAPNLSFRGASAPIARELSDEQQAAYVWVEEAVRQIPPDASLGATNHLGPHATNRAHVTRYPWSTEGDYLLVDDDDLRAPEIAEHAARVASGEFVVITRRGPLSLLRRR